MAVSSNMKFQRKNPYNKFLPYTSDLEEDADKYLIEIKLHVKNDVLKVGISYFVTSFNLTV